MLAAVRVCALSRHGARVTVRRFATSKTPFEISVVNDARMQALGGATRDGLLNKLEAEFQGERVSATRRAEDKLRAELCALESLRADAQAFNAKRKAILNLRMELVIQREASGRTTNTASGVEREYPIPASV